MVRILIAGGSLSGLLHAVFLRRDGHDVAVYERVAQICRVAAAELRLRLRYGKRWSMPVSAAGCEEARGRAAGAGCFDQDGNVIASRIHHQIVTSWDSHYRLLRPALPDEFYHQDQEVKKRAS
jgi:glycine/D-amino acid oxidase-like deaminating enzyme